MLIGEVIKKEREKVKKSVEDMCKELDMSPEQYEKLEAGESPIEIYAPVHAWIAIKLEKPMSRFVAKSGKSKDAKPGQFGQLLKTRREEMKKALDVLAKEVKEGAVDYVKRLPDDRQHSLFDEEKLNKAKQKSEQLAKEVEKVVGDFAKLESGKSEMEKWAPIFLHFAEIIEQPGFNFIYPCGLPASCLTDYP